MTGINTVLIDDEQDALDSLEILLGEYEQVNIIKKTTNPIDIFPLIQTSKIDLVFLDIQMPTVNGLDLMKKIKDCCPGLAVVFVSAHANFVSDAIKLNTFSYLLKPVSREELRHTIEKVQQYLNSLKIAPPNKVLINSKNEIIFINPSEVVFFKADGNYTCIYLIDGTEYMASYNMGAVIGKFPKDIFVRINRSLMVNKDHIVSINRKQKKCIINCGNKQIEVDVSTVFLREVNTIFQS